MDVWSYAVKEKYFLIIVFLCSLLLRGLFFAAYTRYDNRCLLAFDSEQYHHIALQVAANNGITNQDGSPNLYRLPGLPVFLGVCYKFFNGNIEFTLWIQLIFASFIPVLIFALSLALFPGYSIVAKVATVLATVYPGFILYAGMLSSESLFLFFFLLFFVLFFSRLRLWCDAIRLSNRLNLIYFCSGLFLGIASLLRAVGHYTLILAIILLLLSVQPWKKKIQSILFLSLGWMAFVGPWLMRNYLVAGAIFFHTLPGLHFLQYSAVYTVQETDNLDYFQAKKKLFAMWDEQIAQEEKLLERPLNEYERFAVAEKLAFKTIFHDPYISCKHALIQILRTCGTMYSTLLLYVPLGTVYGDASLWFKIKLYLFPRAICDWLILFIYWEMLLYLLILMGCALFFYQIWCYKKLRCVLVKIMPFIVMLVGITLAYGCARLRFPVEPFLLIMASYGWVTLFDRSYYDRVRET